MMRPLLSGDAECLLISLAVFNAVWELKSKANDIAATNISRPKIAQIAIVNVKDAARHFISGEKIKPRAVYVVGQLLPFL